MFQRPWFAPLLAVAALMAALLPMIATGWGASHGFSMEGPETRRFTRPMIQREGKEYRLDWCLLWERNCGKAPADRFCQENGFQGSLKWKVDLAVHAKKEITAIIGEPSTFCPGKFPEHGCDSFEWIDCGRRSPAPLQPAEAGSATPAAGVLH